MSKNMTNAISLAFYITIQDISFFCVNIFMAMQLNTALDYIFLATAIVLVFVTIALLLWQFSIINHKSEED
jgi:hypothetical protein